MEPITTTIEDWTLRVKPPEIRPARVMILLHGWTGDETSMWLFARNLRSDYWLVAPRAPFSAPQGGFSWRPSNPTSTYPPTYEQLRPSAAMLFDFIERWGIANSVNVTQFDMMGFSQGAAMTLAFALTYPQHVRKIGILAGFPPLEMEPLIQSTPLEGKAAFIAHGTADELVHVENARQSISILERAGASVTFCESDVGHKVSAECLRALEEFFSS
jgi:phospholipase/carboxylesterase